MRLKRIKEPPLLSPPELENTAFLNPGDMALMRDKLQSQYYETVGFFHYALKRLGIKEEVTEGHKWSVKGILSSPASKFVTGEDIAKAYHYLGAMGIGEGVNPVHEGKMRRTLEEIRRSGDGRKLASMHHYMMGTGLKTEITAEDRKCMEEELRTQLAKKGPLGVAASIIHDLNTIGLTHKLQPDERERMIRELAKARRQQNAHAIAYIAIVLKEDTEEARTRQPAMPPLKRFGGAR